MNGGQDHGSILAQDYCGVAESTGLGRDCFSQKRALFLINANLLYVSYASAIPQSAQKGDGARVIRGVGGWFIRPKKCLTPSGDESSGNRLKI